jgi:hypothetical protein
MTEVSRPTGEKASPLPSIHSRPGGVHGIPGLGAKTLNKSMLITNTLTIKPNTAATPGPITGVESAFGGVFYLEAVSGVIFQNLTIANSGDYAAVFMTGGCSQNQFLGSTLKNKAPFNAVGSIWMYNNDGGGANIWDNCDFTNNGAPAYMGISMWNGQTAGASVSDTVRNCRFYDFGSTIGTSTLMGTAMRILGGVTGLVVENNEVYDVVPPTGSATLQKYGFHLQGGNGIILRNNVIHDLNAVTANLITGVQTTGTPGCTNTVVEGNIIRDLGTTTTMAGTAPLIQGLSNVYAGPTLFTGNLIKDLWTPTIGITVRGSATMSASRRTPLSIISSCLATPGRTSI